MLVGQLYEIGKDLGKKGLKWGVCRGGVSGLQLVCYVPYP